MPNAVITSLILISSPAFIASMIALYIWAKRGALFGHVWASWMGLVSVAVALILFSITSDMSSGPAELLAATATLSTLIFLVAIPKLKRRIEKSEMNRVVSEDL